MNKAKEVIGALRALPQNELNDLLDQSIAAALENMGEQDRRRIERAAARLAEYMRSRRQPLGERLAKQVLAMIAILAEEAA